MTKDKFAAHRVLNRVGYGVGVRLQLTASQIADRRHALDVEDDKAGVVSVKEPIEFRAGEEIGITHTLTRHEETALEPVDKAASRKTKTSVPVSKPAPVADDETGADQGAGEDNGDSDDDADGTDEGTADDSNDEADGDDAGGN